MWAHEWFYREINTLAKMRTLAKTRACYQFGPLLGEAQINCGIGITLDFFDPDKPSGLVKPTHFMKGSEQKVTLAGECISADMLNNKVL